MAKAKPEAGKACSAVEGGLAVPVVREANVQVEREASAQVEGEAAVRRAWPSSLRLRGIRLAECD